MELRFPPIYLLPTHIPTKQLHDLEDKILTLTYDINEAKVILGKITQKRRAVLELISRQVYTEEIFTMEAEDEKSWPQKSIQDEQPPRKKRRISSGPSADNIIIIDSSTESDGEGPATSKKIVISTKQSQQSTQSNETSATPSIDTMSSPLRIDSGSSPPATVDKESTITFGDTVKVMKLSWYTDSVNAGRLLPLHQYIIYEGRRLSMPKSTSISAAKESLKSEDVLARARKDAPKTGTLLNKGFTKHARVGEHSQESQTRPTQLLQQTTSEHDNPLQLPLVPSWLRNTYSCTRPTPFRSVNDPFICELKKIKLHRVLTRDAIGVRAYSTAIATLAAYPYLIQSAAEVVRLPGCETKIGLLFQEWKDTRAVKAVQDIEADEKFQVLNLFYEIWGVAEVTANEFWNKGYRTLDDLVECEWDNLSRVQQIGVKYYNEFQQKIPRAEVESIAARIHTHANIIHPGFQLCIVGGYRRGKPSSGDVDVVLTHPDEAVTLHFIDSIVSSLEHSSWVSHMLVTTHANSERGQTPVSWKGEMKKAGSGFDTLDKSYLVWQDPNWPTKQADLAANPSAKNPNVHRRLDIIISPWKTAGCAVMGWTSGTTFQRDLRRYCKKFRGLKFDSSGIRSQDDGRWVDFESEGGATLDLADKERRVFRGLGLEWREPEMRCTG